MIRTFMIAILLTGCASKHVAAVMHPEPIPVMGPPPPARIDPKPGDLKVPRPARPGDVIGDFNGIIVPPTWVLKCKEVQTHAEYWEAGYQVSLDGRSEDRVLSEEYAAELLRDGRRQSRKNLAIGILSGLATGAILWEVAR